MKRLTHSRFGIPLLIAVFFLIGLENIQLPPLEKHDWRQTLTLSIAQNFLEHPNILYPRTDIGGETEGIMACEFPVFNYLLAMFFKFFGVHHWFGRLLNWTVSCIGLWFFYDLVKKTFNARAAFFALIAIMASIVFEYARKSMPDTFALFLTISAAWFWWRYLENQSIKYFLAGLVLATLGVLNKIPFLILLTFLIIPFMDRQIPIKPKRNIVLGMGWIMICVTVWYFYWMPYLLEHYKNQLIWPTTLTEGWNILLDEHSVESWEVFLCGPFYFKIPLLVSLMGMGLIFASRNVGVKLFVAAYSLLFFLFTLKSSSVFPTHSYYIIPLLPLLALFIGHFLDQIADKSTYSIAIALIVLTPSFMEKRLRSFTPENGRRYLLTLPEIMDKYTQPSDKIMVNNGIFNPSMMFWTHRKGWTVNQDVPSKQDWMPDFKLQGLQYILMDRHLNNEMLPYPLVFENEHFRLYKP